MTNSGYIYQDIVPRSCNGWTVLDYYSGTYDRTSRTEWTRRFRLGQVFRNGQALNSNTIVRTGDSLQYRRPPWVEPEVPLSFTVVYGDDHILVVDKPAGLPVLPRDVYLEHTLLHQVRIHHGMGSTPVHRIDRGTTGLVLFARTHLARRALGRAMQNGLVAKTYLAVVTGRDAGPSRVVELKLGSVPHPRLGKVTAVVMDGMNARTRYRIAASVPGGHSLAMIALDTGRAHQIRIHLAADGRPLVGDPLYGETGGKPDPNHVPGDIGFRLHAWRLRFPHPAENTRMRFTAGIPDSFHRPGSVEDVNEACDSV